MALPCLAASFSELRLRPGAVCHFPSITVRGAELAGGSMFVHFRQVSWASWIR